MMPTSRWRFSPRSHRGAALVIAGALVGCGTGDAAGIFAPAGGAGASSGAAGGGAANGGGSGLGGPGEGGGGAGGSGQGGTAASASGGSASGGASSGGSSSGGRGGMPVSDAGCSDGTREAYEDLAAQPNIAACAGGFSVPGVTTSASMQPACGYDAGNDSNNPSGQGCSVADLCAAGWHVCADKDDVAKSAEGGACPEFPVLAPSAFYLTRQSQDQGDCAPSPAVNNVVGCGNTGDLVLFQDCDPLNRRLRGFECSLSQSWDCGGNGAEDEAEIVTKLSADGGGVLCCRD